MGSGGHHGANIQDGTVTGADVRNGSITSIDIARTTRLALQGRDGRDGRDGLTGAPGANGTNGTNGAQGPAGAQGPTGAAGTARAAAAVLGTTTGCSVSRTIAISGCSRLGEGDYRLTLTGVDVSNSVATCGLIDPGGAMQAPWNCSAAIESGGTVRVNVFQTLQNGSMALVHDPVDPGALALAVIVS